MARIKIEDLPVNQDLSEAEAKNLKAGAVSSGANQPFTVSMQMPPPPTPNLVQFTNLTSFNLKVGGGQSLLAQVAYNCYGEATAGVRG